jgi:hypothetical protein
MDKNNFTDEQKIEYYLGKDGFKDIYFKPEFPEAYQDIHSPTIKPEEYKSCQKKLNPWHKDMVFNLNNKGYRSNWDYHLSELQAKDNIVLCLGCTDTFGMNVSFENLWTTRLQEKLPEMTVMNCGIIGASSDTVHRIIAKVLPVLPTQIKHICLLWPHSSRREFVSKTYTHIVNSAGYQSMPLDDYHSFIDWKSDNYNTFKNYHAVVSACAQYNVTLHDLFINRFDKKVPFDFSSVHYAFGEKSHTAISEYFYKRVSGKPSLFEDLKK